jgi:hypothetical protein
MRASLTLSLALLALPAAAATNEPADAFDSWLDGAEHAATQFLAPVALVDGWRIVPSQAGERWTRPGSGSAYLFASAPGVVREVAGDAISIAHVFYENHHRREVVSTYTGLDRATVAAGDVVEPGRTVGVVVGAPVSFTWTLDAQERPSELVGRALDGTRPLDEDVLVLVHHETRRMRVYEKGERTHDLRIGFGQAEGRKRVQGDLKTPMGLYFVTKKHRGEFSGRWAAYYGGHWIKVSYPNAYDAAWGRAAGHLTAAQERAIAKAWRRRELPSQKTKLGGGIGFHGWIGEWSDDDPWLSWGCVVMHNEDISRVFDRVPVGAMVVIF